MNMFLCEDLYLSRTYIEKVDEKLARHTSYIWSYDKDCFVPYDSYTFNYTQYGDENWEIYCKNLLKVRPTYQLINME